MRTRLHTYTYIQDMSDVRFSRIGNTSRTSDVVNESYPSAFHLDNLFWTKGTLSFNLPIVSQVSMYERTSIPVCLPCEQQQQVGSHWSVGANEQLTLIISNSKLGNETNVSPWNCFANGIKNQIAFAKFLISDLPINCSLALCPRNCVYFAVRFYVGILLYI